MLIKVTQEDITAGTELDGQTCPIALACKREIKEDIHICHTYIDYPEIGRVCWLPKEATTFITSFDFGIKVDPFEFEIEYPPLSRPPGTK